MSKVRILPADTVFRKWLGDSLVWLPERGVGWFPVEAEPYDDAYFEKYRRYAATELGRALTDARIGFVAQHHSGPLVDVGIGCGQFVDNRPQTNGFDINPAGIAWLAERDLFVDPRQVPCVAATFWDSLEHIHEPRQILDNIERWAFVSLPVFEGPDHVLTSKHYRRDEHCWYFTRDGLVSWMEEQGFGLVVEDDFEARLGREGIASFAFQRKKPAHPSAARGRFCSLDGCCLPG